MNKLGLTTDGICEDLQVCRIPKDLLGLHICTFLWKISDYIQVGRIKKSIKKL